MNWKCHKKWLFVGVVRRAGRRSTHYNGAVISRILNKKKVSITLFQFRNGIVLDVRATISAEQIDVCRMRRVENVIWRSLVAKDITLVRTLWFLHKDAELDQFLDLYAVGQKHSLGGSSIDGESVVRQVSNGNVNLISKLQLKFWKFVSYDKTKN